MRSSLALLLILCLMAGAMAQSNDRFRIELGLSYLDDDSAWFGRYNGLTRQRGYGVLNIDWWRVAERPDQADLQLAIRSLGRNALDVEFVAQRPGAYRVWLSYVELPVYLSESALTPFLNAGSSTLYLPSDWQAGSTTAGFGRLYPSLSRYRPKLKRETLALGLNRWLSQRWSTDLRVNEQRRQGLKMMAGTIGNTGGNPRVVFLPAPVDERTRELQWTLHFAQPQRQFSFGYLLSLFDNDRGALRWQNPFSAIAGWHPSAGHPSGEGQLAMPPSNQFHRINAVFVQSWNNGLRLSAEATRGRGTQDEPFLPYTVNPLLAASITEPLPSDSLRGRVDIQGAQLRLSQRLANGFDWALRWRDDRRDNQTPQESFVYIGGDSTEQDSSAISSRRRLNEPYSFRQRQFGADAGYRLSRSTAWQFGWQHEEIERDAAERYSTREDRWELGYQQTLFERSDLRLSLQKSDRGGSTYVGNRPFLAAYTPDFVATVPGEFENHPDLRRFHLADRTRWQGSARWTFQPSSRWLLSLQGDSQRDDYRASTLGLREADARILTAHVQLTLSAPWTLGMNHVDERRTSDQAGQSFRGGASRLDQAFDPANQWRVLLHDRWRTTGINLSWRPLDTRFSAVLDLLQSKGRSTFDVVAGNALRTAPLPDRQDRLHSMRLELAWRASERSEWKLGWWRANYRFFDPLEQAFPPDQLANVLLPGAAEPDYRVNVLTLTWIRSF